MCLAINACRPDASGLKLSFVDFLGTEFPGDPGAWGSRFAVGKLRDFKTRAGLTVEKAYNLAAQDQAEILRFYRHSFLYGSKQDPADDG